MRKAWYASRDQPSDCMKPESISDKPLEEPPEPGVLTYFLQFFGSLKLAMGLLAILIGACIVGTIVESRLDATVAQAYIYDSPWFIAWLVLLCMNLICSALVRYPWKPHLTGFVITHAGIVTVLIGAIIGRIWGVEGHITLYKGEDPLNTIVTRQKLLEVRTGAMEASSLQALPIEVHAPSPERPLSFDVNGVKVLVLGYAEELGMKTVVEEGGADGSPALHFVMQSAMVPKPIEQWLVLGDVERSRADLGPAVVRLAADTARPAAARNAGQSEPSRAVAQLSREVRYAFAKMPEMGVTRSLEGQPTGVQAVYRFDSSVQEHQKSHGVLQVDVGDKKFEFPVGRVLGKSTPLKGTPWTLRVLKYFADFRLNGKDAVSVSDEPNNPALMFELAGKTAGRLSASLGGNAGMLVHGHAQPSMPQKNTLTLYRDSAGRLRFEATSQKHGPTSGEVEPGKEFSPGWADWRLKVDQQVASAVIREELAPLSEGIFRPAGMSGIRVRVEKNGDSAMQWIGMASPVHLRVGGESVHVSFGPRLHPLSFGVALENFEVERDEGIQSPAGFKSRVRFADSGSKTVMEREIWMNHPADFPDFPGAGLLGTSYKFSQASWNPNDLNQTTLQVLRDPGWSLKWIGSLMVCGGIFTMFYIKPYLAPQEEKKS